MVMVMMIAPVIGPGAIIELDFTPYELFPVGRVRCRAIVDERGKDAAVRGRNIPDAFPQHINDASQLCDEDFVDSDRPAHEKCSDRQADMGGPGSDGLKKRTGRLPASP